MRTEEPPPNTLIRPPPWWMQSATISPGLWFSSFSEYQNHTGSLLNRQEAPNSGICLFIKKHRATSGKTQLYHFRSHKGNEPRVLSHRPP